MSKLADRPEIRSAWARIRSLLHHVRVKVFSQHAGRVVIATLSLLALTWLFGQVGVLDKLDRVVSDVQSLANPVPTDGTVALVLINDSEYRKYFDGGIATNPDYLMDLVNAIARGGPSVIAIDVDTSPHQFASTRAVDCDCAVVWEREVEELPENVETGQQFKLLPILGGKSDLGNARTSSGIPVLVDDPEDGVTRRFQRYFLTDEGYFPSFTAAIAAAYAKNQSDSKLSSQVSGFSDQELLIRYSGDQQGSHRLLLTSSKMMELSQAWSPQGSPIKGRIVLLGGDYLGEDQHKTPLGRLSGAEVLANVIETELHGNVAAAPNRLGNYVMDLVEAFPLILFFHFFRFGRALAASTALTPVFALICSWISFHDFAHVGHFLVVLFGLLCFELYEHFRREQFPHLMAHKESKHH